MKRDQSRRAADDVRFENRRGRSAARENRTDCVAE